MKRLNMRHIFNKSAIVLGVLALLVVGCSKEAEPEVPADPFDKPYSRMEDKAYTNLLHTQMTKRMDLASRIRALEDELKAAEAKDPKSAEVETLRVKIKDLCKEYDMNRSQTEQLVRMRILRENAAIEAREARENKKNNISSKGK